MGHSQELSFAVDAVRAGARLARRVQRQHATEALEKADKSPVTIADFAVQALVAAMLERAFPLDPLVAEEDSGPLRDPSHSRMLEEVSEHVASERPSVSPQEVCAWIDRGMGDPGDRFWTLDPVDGTKGFLRQGQYVVALALIEAGAVVLAALGCPNLGPSGAPDPGGSGCIVWAARGSGSWIEAMEGGDRRQLARSTTRDPAAARLLRSVEESHTDADRMQALAKQLGVERPPVLMDSQAKYVLLASGAGDLLVRMVPPAKLDYREKIWDQAAGSLIVEEAGGHVSDLRGEALDFSAGRLLINNLGVLATNGHLHRIALHGVWAVGADHPEVTIGESAPSGRGEADHGG